MHHKCIKGVIKLDRCLHLYGDIAANCHNRANNDRLGHIYEASGGGNPHQASHSAGGCTHGGGFAIAEPFNQAPGEHCRRSGQAGGHEGEACTLGREVAGAIEAKPAKPEQAGTQQNEGHVMGWAQLIGIGAAGTNDSRRYQSGYAGSNMHYSTASKINYTQLPERTDISTSPDHLGHGTIDENTPEE